MSVTISKQPTELRILSSFVGTNAIDREDLLREFGKGAETVIERLVKEKKLAYIGPRNGSEMMVTLVITIEGKKFLSTLQAKTNH